MSRSDQFGWFLTVKKGPFLDSQGILASSVIPAICWPGRVCRTGRLAGGQRLCDSQEPPTLRPRPQLPKRLLTTLSLILLGTSSAAALPKLTVAPKVGIPTSRAAANVVAIRTSTHPGFDRLVFQFQSRSPGYRVRYVRQVLQDASGLPIPLKGSRFLSISFSPARVTAAPGNLTPAFPVLREVAKAGDFEQVVSYGAGLAKQRPFRVFALKAPPRIVIDIAH